MDRGKAESYSSAANWLAKVRAAYRALGHEEEWLVVQLQKAAKT